MCYYCNSRVFVWYTNVREPKQWTLDRIDNHNGHNVDNVKIACLACNLKRRTTDHVRYKYTKDVRLNKI